MINKRIISVVLSMIMCISIFPTLVFADNGSAEITVQSVSAPAGTVVDVPVTIKGNPGILGAELKFTYDEKLTLKGITNGEAFSPLTMTKPGKLTSPCKVIWDGQDLEANDIKDGTIVTLHFAVSDDAKEGDIYNVTASYDNGGFVDYDLMPVDIEITSGAVSVVSIKYGDVNDDTNVNTTDVIMMRRHIAGGYNQIINEAAADVNVDTKLNTQDVIIERRYIAGGYEIDALPYIVHNHNLVHHDAVEPTETSEGNVEYWECTVCGKYFADAEGKNALDSIKPVKSEYTIQYECSMIPQRGAPTEEDKKYTYGVEKVLPTPEIDKYTFVGWSVKDAKQREIIKTIPAGMTGNLILQANWASNRNQAIPVQNLAEPYILENTEEGKILFAYEIGKIVNVPLYTTLELQCANGIITTVRETHESTVNTETAKTVAQTISVATSNSATWTLENGWNETTSVDEKWAETHGKTVEEATAIAKSSSETYGIVNSVGGQNMTSSSSSGSYSFSENDAHSRGFDVEHMESVDLTTDHKFSAEVSASVPISIVNVGAKVGYEYNNNKVEKTYDDTKLTGSDEWSSSSNISGMSSNSSTSSKSWNTDKSFTQSSSISQTDTVSKALSEIITNETNYGKTNTVNGKQIESNTGETSNSSSEETSSTIKYFESAFEGTTREFTSTGYTYGNYRMVMAGTVHVFAVVAYDVASETYSVSTYNVLGTGNKDDAPKEYLDYSYDGTFNDYETTRLPFEVPFEVNKYINGRITKTRGLRFDLDKGEATSYSYNANDEIVYVPSYVKSNNNDGTASAVKISSINSKLFKGNTTIEAVSLGKFVTEIPDGAFEGCTSLKYVYAPGVTKIGENAFKGCTALEAFTVSDKVIELGESAFDGVNSQITVYATNKSVANAAAKSGADNLVLNLSGITDSDNIELNVGEISNFELYGGDKEYKGMSIKSDASTTVINGVAITENTKMPIELSSENVRFDRVTVDCYGLGLALKADNTSLTLNRTNSIMSSSENAILCKGISISEYATDVVGKLNIKGNMLVASDSVPGEECLDFASGEIIYINDEEFDNYLSAKKVSFDANGGMTNAEDKSVAYNGTFGELPIASRDYYTFDGWYTTADGGEKITADSIMTSLVDITLYAHWIENDVSEWVPKSEMPEDAQRIATKYKYDLTSYTSSSSSTLNDWTPYGSTWVWSAYGNWSGWQDSYVGGSDSREVQTQQVVASSNYKTVYRYYRYSTAYDGSTSWSSYSTQNPYYYEYTFDSPLTYDSRYSGYQWWYSSSHFRVLYWLREEQQWVSDNYKTQYRYRDRHKIYTYYYKKTQNDLELDYYPTYALLSSVSESNHPTGDYMSNVQEYVQYRTK
ncbi:MAG: InlB B-repeat-containing protein [Clostridia bacterium]|nr:InlB B-repeat-containing protein [Clostridia bacterium]